MAGRRESIGRLHARTQSTSGPPATEFVSVAVLPPRLPSGMAAPTGVGAAGVFSWDESLNTQGNDPIKEGEQKKSLMKKMGLTTERLRKNPDLPPFMFRQVPYDIWRKHYAKDKEGNYRGTHAPAADCLLKPDDVKKWQLGDPVTAGDRWTRGREILPVYEEVTAEGRVPDYEADYDGPPRDLHPDEKPRDNKTLSISSSTGEPPATTETAQSSSSKYKYVEPGRTTEQILAEANAQPKPKLTWKQKIQKGAEFAMMGTNA